MCIYIYIYNGISYYLKGTNNTAERRSRRTQRRTRSEPIIQLHVCIYIYIYTCVYIHTNTHIM